jgi:cell division protease FtsH
MVMQYGMTERLGAIKYGKESGEVFMGRDMGHTRDFSEEVAAAIDEEVRAFIESAHQEAYDLLVANRDALDAIVVALMERETLDKFEIEEIFRELNLREPRNAWTGSARRAPDLRGPVEVAELERAPVEKRSVEVVVAESQAPETPETVI